MIIVSAADEKFAPHFATMLHSAWTMHPEAGFYLIDCGLRESTRDRLLGFATRNPIDLAIVEMGDYFDSLPTTVKYPRPVYARLATPYLIPHARRAIYLDADTAVVGDLTELWEMELHGHVVAGVYDSSCPSKGSQRDYINSGVMLFDCVAWRQQKIPEWCIASASRYPARFPDQDAINATCRGHIQLLPPKWNFMLHDNGHTRPPEDVRVVHWSGPLKPWYYRDAVMSSIYLFHRNLTPFSLETPPRVYRSWPRVLANLLIGRPKYWRRMRMHATCRDFTMTYLKSVVAS